MYVYINYIYIYNIYINNYIYIICETNLVPFVFCSIVATHAHTSHTGFAFT